MGHRYGSRLAMTTYQVPDRPVDLTSARYEGHETMTKISDWHSSVAYLSDKKETITINDLKNSPKLQQKIAALTSAESLVKEKFGRTSELVNDDVSA